LFLLCFGLGCAAEPAAPSLDAELRAAWDAYAAYCGLCPASATCCLHEADFSRPRFAATATAYLRALQEHFECRRGDTLIDASLGEPGYDPQDARERLRLPRRSLKLSCEMNACMSSAETMAKELDRALATPTPHEPGTPLICSGRAGSL
jgi:hypothetical protein